MASAPYIGSSVSTREVRFHFGSSQAFQAGLDRARREPWVASLRADRFRREIVVELAGGFGKRPPLRVIEGGGEGECAGR
jgi:hypothetical protein